MYGQGMKAEYQYPKWGNIFGDIQRQADLIALIKELSAGKLEEDITFNLSVGAIESGEILTQGLSFTDVVKAIAKTTYFPQLINPSFSLSVTGSSLRVIGSSTSFNLVFNFNRGNIKGKTVNGTWEPNTSQGARAGAAISYTIDGVNQASNTLSKSIIVAKGNNIFSGFVSYGEGIQPLDSDGNNFQSPLPADDSPTRSASFEGIYPLFGSTSTIDTATQQALYSMKNANNIVMDLVAETGGNKQFFEIPTDWLTARPLVKIEFFNTVSGSFDTTDQLSTFTTSNITKTIEGNAVGYVKYTNNQADRGALKIRLKF